MGDSTGGENAGRLTRLRPKRPPSHVVTFLLLHGGAGGLFRPPLTNQRREPRAKARSPPALKCRFPPRFLCSGQGPRAGETGKGEATPKPAGQGSHCIALVRVRRHTEASAIQWADRLTAVLLLFESYIHSGGGEGPPTLTIAAKAAGYRAQRGAAWRNRAKKPYRAKSLEGSNVGARAQHGKRESFAGDTPPRAIAERINRRPALRRWRHQIIDEITGAAVPAAASLAAWGG